MYVLPRLRAIGDHQQKQGWNDKLREASSQYAGGAFVLDFQPEAGPESLAAAWDAFQGTTLWDEI